LLCPISSKISLIKTEQPNGEGKKKEPAGAGSFGRLFRSYF